jgi:hypothetical protein
MKKLNRTWQISMALILLGAASAPAVQAETILVSQSTMISGSFSAVYSFATTQSGTLNLHLENVAWPERLASLSCNLYTNEGMLGSIATDGMLSIAVTGPGTYYSHLFAQAAGALDLGVFSFNVTFEPSVAAVPLPAALWLLLSSLCGFFGLKRVGPVVRFALRGHAFA